MIHEALQELEATQQRLRDSHDELRTRLAEIEALAVQAPVARAESAQTELVAAIWGLFLAAEKHQAFVDEHVAADVERLHGLERLHRLRKEHSAQRRRVGDSVNQCDAAARRADGLLSAAAQVLVQTLRSDIAREEHLLDISRTVSAALDGVGPARQAP